MPSFTGIPVMDKKNWWGKHKKMPSSWEGGEIFYFETGVKNQNIIKL